jgi:sulfoxide reductase heme-binding subunit YedZ
VAEAAGGAERRVNELLWYVSRAMGTASLALLTAVLVLGTITAGRRSPQSLAPAVVMSLHRTLALGTTAFLLAHIATAVGETYVSIDLVSTVVPFTSGYESAWVGLGTVAFDLAVALVATSLLRNRLPPRLWKGVHLLAFALWPTAVVHAYAMGTANEPLLRGITLACAAAGLAAVAWRTVSKHADRSRRHAVALQEWS